jgi:hypothetical protein
MDMASIEHLLEHWVLGISIKLLIEKANLDFGWIRE